VKYVDEFRDRDKAGALIREIARVLERIPAARQRPLKVMEVCGGHTHSIFRYGIEGSCHPSSSSSTVPDVRSVCFRWAGSTTASRSPSIRR
jgi:hypothetical protein